MYVGSGTSRDFDQVLDSALVGPIPEGRHKFVFDAEHPDISKIPVEDIVGVSVLLLRCKYNDQEFINMGWFVANEYTDEELKENPPAKPLIEKVLFFSGKKHFISKVIHTKLFLINQAPVIV